MSPSFFSVTVIATGTPLPPSPVSAAATAALMFTVMRWTQVHKYTTVDTTIIPHHIVNFFCRWKIM